MHRITLGKRVVLGWCRTDQGVKRLFSIGSLDVYTSQNKRDMHIIVLDRCNINSAGKQKLVMEISLSRIAKRSSWHVNLARLDHRYSGQNIAPRVYYRLIKSMPEFILEAGHLQSQGGRNIWAKLAKQKGVYVFAQNRNGAYPVDVDEDNNELTCDQVKVYGTGTNVFAMAA